MMEQPPKTSFTQEIRFAVVMYGGISLAIYMNGVVQELRKMVRATAPSKDDAQRAALADGDLGRNDTEVVYRELGRMLSWGVPARERSETVVGEPLRTRFVVDILSGSSAGGIDAVYLAKALANDQPMDGLKKLWTEEGDISKLINDKASIKGTYLEPQVPPGSLLNGARMYSKLLEALDSMDPKDDADGPRAQNVEELDLYVTATDMAGQPVKLQLADKVVEELRHRNVFHFRYRDGKPNDFSRIDNPFLAFAARCTSAHPSSFEPMRLGDANQVLDRYLEGARDDRSGNKEWRRFFKEYLRPGDGDPEDLATKFLSRDFNDGGVLDNRPFRHATDTIPLHRAGVPVSRKLVYLDPAPERLRIVPESKRRPNVAENVWASLSTLPRYEPIQEDLQRVLHRNRLIERVNVIIEGMEERDFQYDEAWKERQASVLRQAYYDDEQWDRMTMSEMVRKRGLTWASYQHLRVTQVTDDLALLLTRVAGLDDDSDEFRAVRQLVRFWREEHFAPDFVVGKLTEHAFLRRFDVGWRLRRLRYVLAKIDGMLVHERAHALVEQARQPGPGEPGSRNFDEFRETLSSLRRELDGVLTGLRRSRDRLWEAHDEHPLQTEVENTGLRNIDLTPLLDPGTAGGPSSLVAATANAKETQFEKLGSRVEECLQDMLERAREDIAGILPRPPLEGYANEAATAAEIARRAARFYYDDFASYDMISYPILYSTEVGEEMARMDVFRISPDDAPSLIQETLDKPKLAGTKVNSFGAFFEERFRTNDILWGRLDGAERIISALLPTDEDREKREELISAAHRAILDEEVFSKEGARALPPAAQSTDDVLNRYRSKYDEEYEATRRLDPQRTLHSAARASRVFGDMLDGYAETQRRLPKGGVVWITRLARLFWVLVEVAMPGSLASLVFRHGLKLLYVFEVLTILLGTLLLYPTVQQFGFVAFVVTATAHATVLLLEDTMSEKQNDGGERGRKKPWRRIATYVFASLIALACALGLILAFAALGLDFPRRLVEILTGLSETAGNAGTVANKPPRAAGNASGPLARGAVMLVIVAVFLLTAGRGIWKRRNG
jgi:patatin-related protein